MYMALKSLPVRLYTVTHKQLFNLPNRGNKIRPILCAVFRKLDLMVARPQKLIY